MYVIFIPFFCDNTEERTWSTYHQKSIARMSCHVLYTCLWNWIVFESKHLLVRFGHPASGLIVGVICIVVASCNILCMVSCCPLYCYIVTYLCWTPPRHFHCAHAGHPQLVSSQPGARPGHVSANQRAGRGHVTGTRDTSAAISVTGRAQLLTLASSRAWFIRFWETETLQAQSRYLSIYQPHLK